MERLEKIKKALEHNFKPSKLEIFDDSDLHAGHEGAKSGKGHYRVIIESDYFIDISLIEMHRKVYKALEGLLETDIHALSLDTKATEKKPHDLT